MEDSEEGERPHKRINRGESENHIDLLRKPDSLDVLRPAAPKRFDDSVSMSSVSSDESLPDASDSNAGPSRSRIIRRMTTPPPPSSSEPTAPEKEAKFNVWRILNMHHATDVLRAAWQQASGDETKATSLLNDPTFKPPSVSASTSAPGRAVVKNAPPNSSRDKGRDDVNKAQRAAVRERGKKSVIYQRPHVENKHVVSTPPTSSSALPKSSPRTPWSPEVAKPGGKRLKRKVVDSDSEAEVDNEPPVRVNGKRIKDESSDEHRVLKYFNTTSVEGLQELTGMFAISAS